MCTLGRIRDLEIRVFIIGYRKEGEAIVVLFRDKEKNMVFYSLAIDCYSYKGNMKSKRNLTDEILRKYKVKNLNVLCWTHPHMDHSKDLLKIFHKYCRISTRVIKPRYFNNKESDIISIKDKPTKRVVESLFKLNALNRNVEDSASAPKEGYTMREEFEIFSSDAQPKKVGLRILSPVDSIIEQYFKEGRKLEDLNGISISMILDIDGYSMMFAGDTTNDHISLMKKEYLRDCHLVKTPHHTSRTGREMVFHLAKDNLDTACTTLYGKSNPVDFIVEEYKEKTDYFFSTGYKETSLQKTFYGVVEYIFDFESPNIHMNVNLYGNAHQM